MNNAHTSKGNTGRKARKLVALVLVATALLAAVTCTSETPGRPRRQNTTEETI